VDDEPYREIAEGLDGVYRRMTRDAEEINRRVAAGEDHGVVLADVCRQRMAMATASRDQHWASAVAWLERDNMEFCVLLLAMSSKGLWEDIKQMVDEADLGTVMCAILNTAVGEIMYRQARRKTDELQEECDDEAEGNPPPK
jgi:hypothetical protein